MMKNSDLTIKSSLRKTKKSTKINTKERKAKNIKSINSINKLVWPEMSLWKNAENKEERWRVLQRRPQWTIRKFLRTCVQCCLSTRKGQFSRCSKRQISTSNRHTNDCSWFRLTMKAKRRNGKRKWKRWVCMKRNKKRIKALPLHHLKMRMS